MPAPREPTGGSVCAVGVTFNRRELLERCLTALSAQSRPVDAVLVVDNAGTDGTPAFVREAHPDVELLSLPANVGGAGGFAAGMERAHAAGHEWVWLMDDDTLAEPDALAALLDGSRRAPGTPPIVASQVRWKDGSLHPMNRPFVRWDDSAAMAEAARRGLVALRNATFVSVLVRREAIDRHGVAPAKFFIWGDDFEFTSRVLRETPGYLVPESRVVHWTEQAHTS